MAVLEPRAHGQADGLVPSHDESSSRTLGVILFSAVILAHRILERQGQSNGALDLAVCAGASVVGFFWPIGAVVGVLGSIMIGETAVTLGASLSLWLRAALVLRLAVDVLGRRIPLTWIASGTYRYWLPFAGVVLASYIVYGSAGGTAFIVKFALTAAFIGGCVAYVRGLDSLLMLQVGLVVTGLISAAWGILHVFHGEWRIGGLEANPNHGAMYLCTAFFLALGLLDRKGAPKILSLAAVICVPLGILTSGSRGGAAVLVIGTLAYLLLFGRSSRRILLVTGLSVIIGVVAFILLPQFITNSRILHTFGNLLSGSTIDPETGRDLDRLPLWRDSIRLWLAHPILGVGPQRWFEARVTMNETARTSAAHMYLLQILSELGTVGGLAYVYFLARSFRGAVGRLRRTVGASREILTGWVVAGFALAASVFSGDAYSPYLHSVIVIATSAVLLAPGDTQGLPGLTAVPAVSGEAEPSGDVAQEEA